MAHKPQHTTIISTVILASNIIKLVVSWCCGSPNDVTFSLVVVEGNNKNVVVVVEGKNKNVVVVVVEGKQLKCGVRKAVEKWLWLYIVSLFTKLC